MDDDSDAPTDVAMSDKKHRMKGMMDGMTQVSLLTTDPLGILDDDFTTGAISLCGRDEQMRVMQAAYQRAKTGASEVVFIEGISGTGKSSLVESMRDAVTMYDGGFFVTGKFDQLQTKEPFSAIAAALSDICDLILQSKWVEDIRESLAKALGPGDGMVLSSVVSSFNKITMEEYDSTGEYGDLFSRFKVVSKLFLRAVATEERPVLLFLDDLQWADETSMKLINAFICDMESRHVLFCIAARGDEHDIEARLDVKREGMSHLAYSKVLVGNLDECDLGSMLSQLLHMDRGSLGSLVGLILEKTKGNPNSIVQLLQLLKTRDLLTFSNEMYNWEWNVSVIESEISDNPMEIISQKMERLDKQVLETLQLAAYIGNTFGIDALRYVVLHDDRREVQGDYEETRVRVKHDLDVAICDGLIMDKDCGKSYRFSHDSNQHYLYSSVTDEADRERMHLRVGRGLVACRQADAELSGALRPDESVLLLAASNMARGAHHISNDEERVSTMQLCLDAAILSASKASVVDAKDYLDCAMRLRTDDDWISNFPLIMKLYIKYAEALNGAGLFAESDRAIEVALSHAKSSEDKMRAQCTKTRTLVSRRKYDEAVEWSCDVVLKSLGERIPKNPSKGNVLVEMIKTKRAIGNKDPSYFLRLPPMENVNKLGVSEAMSILAPVIFSGKNPLLFVFITLRHMRMTLRYGISSYSAGAIAGYGILLHATSKFGKAYEYGNVALQLSGRPDASLPARTQPLLVTGMFLTPWREELKNCVALALSSFQLGMQSGTDLATAFYAIYTYLDVRHYLGAPLPELEQEIHRYCALARDLQANHQLSFLTTLWQYVLNLLGQSDDPVVMNGEAMIEQQHFRTAEEEGNESGIGVLHLFRMRLQLSFEEWDALGETLLSWFEVSYRFQGLYNYLLSSGEFVIGCLIVYVRSGKKKYRDMARKFTKKIEFWAKNGVPSAVPILALVTAEWIAVTDKAQYDKVVSLYNDAIKGFAGQEFVFLETLAYQRVMHFALRQIDLRKAQFNLNESLERHRKWGNIAKVEWLQITFHDVLVSVRPVFQVKVTNTLSTETNTSQVMTPLMYRES